MKSEREPSLSTSDLAGRGKARTTDQLPTGAIGNDGESDPFRKLIDAIPRCGSFTIDPGGQVVNWSDAAQRLFGFAADQIAGRPLSKLLRSWPSGAWLADLLPSSSNGDLHESEIVGVRADGSTFAARITFAPIKSAAGELGGYACVVQDVTDAEHALQDQARLADIVESSDDAILSKDLNGIILSWNDGAHRLLGYTADEIVGRSINRLVPQERAGEERMIVTRIARGERVDHYETVRRRKDGSLVEMSMSVSPIRDASGRIVAASTIARDIGQRKHAEAMIRESESRFRLTFEYAPIGIEQVALDDGRLLAVNEWLCRLLGYRREELLQKDFEQITDAADLPAERRLLRALLADEVPSYTIEKRYHKKKGGQVWVRVTSAKAEGDVGVPHRISIVEHIGERKRAEAALLDSEQRMRAIVETAVDAIVTIDPKGIIRAVNPATERLFGYPIAELLGRNVNMLMPEPFRSGHDGYLKSYLRTGRARIIGIGREVTAIRRDGTTFPANLAINEVHAGKDRLFVGMVHDLSSQRLMEREIVEAGANEQRRIGQDLHDGLCQDLIGVAFQADFSAKRLENLLPTESRTIAEIASSIRASAAQARRLSHGLNPVNLAAGGLPVALEAMTRRISESFAVDCQLRWDRVAEVVDDTTATHLYRIAQEAVSNALKHGAAKKIQVLLMARGNRLVLSVRDNGRGLPSADPVPHVESAARPGEGIGLHTMRYRANLVGGVFGIGPARGGGTLVTCSIPRVRPDRKEKTDLARRPAKKLRAARPNPVRDRA